MFAPSRNCVCVFCSTKDAVCSIACASYIYIHLNKNVRRYCGPSIMHVIPHHDCALIKLAAHAWFTHNWTCALEYPTRDNQRKSPSQLRRLFHIYMHVGMACSMFTNHNAYTTYKAYESFSNSSVGNPPMENALPYPAAAQSSILQTTCSVPSQQGALHKPPCRYTYALPSQALGAGSGGNILENRINSIFDPELEARAKQLQELERWGRRDF